MRYHLWYIIAATLLLGGLGCNRGYISANDLATGEIGPRNCEETCTGLGLQMGAFVLMQHSYAGCVCQPVQNAGGSVELSGATLQAGAVLAVEETRRQQAAVQQQQLLLHQ